MIVAVVLSAGESSRMGRPKALLPIDGSRFIERIVASLKTSSVGDVLIVLGHNASEISQQIEHLSAKIVVNPDYRQGQLSSLQTAIRFIEKNLAADEIEGILVHLVDHPFLNSALVDRMIGQFRGTGNLIVVPRFHGRRGHPVLFSKKLFPELLSAPLEEGAKSVVHAHQAQTLELETEDEGITIDLDTPEEYRKHVKGD